MIPVRTASIVTVVGAFKLIGKDKTNAEKMKIAAISAALTDGAWKVMSVVAFRKKTSGSSCIL